MSKKSLIFIAIILISSLWAFSEAKAVIMASNPEILISNFKAGLADGKEGQIDGSFYLKNISDRSLTDVSFYLTLRPEPVLEKWVSGVNNLVIQQIVAKYQANSPFELAPGQQKSFSFSLTHPMAIKSGQYQLSLRVGDTSGFENYSSSVLSLSLTGRNKMLVIPMDNCKIVAKDKTEYPAYIGAPFAPGEEPEAECQVSNPTNEPVEFSVNYETAIYDLLSYRNQQIQKTSSSQTYALKAKETKTITLTLPKEDKPDIYETYAQLIKYETEENTSVVSPYLVFRWTIKGAAARINNISVDPFKSNYSKSEKIAVTADFSPSPDIFWRVESEQPATDLQNTKLILTVYDKNNKVCGKTEQDLGKISEEVTGEKSEISFNSDCEASKLSAQISTIPQGVLTEYFLKFPSPKPTSTPVPIISSGQVLIYYLLFGLLAIVLLIFAIVAFKKGKTIIAYILIIGILILIASAIFISFAQADSGSFGFQETILSYGWDGHLNTRFTVGIPQYQIDNFSKGNAPASANVKIDYCGKEGLCDNYDIVIYLTLKIDNDNSTVQKIRINNTGMAGQECGILPINFLSYFGANAFSQLGAGNHTITVDGRLVIYHIWTAMLLGYTQPTSQHAQGSMKVGIDCATAQIHVPSKTRGEAEMVSYANGWNESVSAFNVCGDGQTIPQIQRTHVPLTFTLPFKVYEPTLSVVPPSAIIKVGETQKYTALYDPDGPSEPQPNQDVSALPLTVWSTSNSSIAQINNTGMATGRAQGSVLVNATYNGLTARADLVVTLPLTLVPQRVQDPDYCEQAPFFTMSWAIVEGNQSAYQIQVSPNSSFSPLIADTGKVSSTSNFYRLPINNLAYGATYHWRVKGWDESKNFESPWTLGLDFGMTAHKWPKTDFSFEPEPPKIPKINENINMTDKSECYNAANNSVPCKSREWIIPADGGFFYSTGPSSKKPIIRFSAAGQKEVRLEATDSETFTCHETKTITVETGKVSSPKWIEIIPSQ